jgi:3-methyl-2-oxobutanoate hydroxymethyltransferase
MSAQTETVRRLSVLDIAKLHADGVRIATITAYDYPTAQVVDEAGIPLILVGDSLAQVLLGYDTTVRVTMDEMLHHTKAVVRGTKRALIVADMPFLSYPNADAALTNAGRFMREAGVQAVKLEGGVRSAKTIEALVRAGIPVMGHIGLTPQSATMLGGYKAQGRSAEAALALLDDARALEAAGCFSLVLEAVPAPVAKHISERLAIPTIGIGAGADTDGQVLVWHDLLGLYDGRVARFVKRYAEVGETIRAALEAFADDVRQGRFPEERHTYAMPAEELAIFEQAAAGVSEHQREHEHDRSE